MRIHMIEPVTSALIAWGLVSSVGSVVGLDTLVEKAGAIGILGGIVWFLLQRLEKTMGKVGESVDKLVDTVEKHSCKFKGD